MVQIPELATLLSCSDFGIARSKELGTCTNQIPGFDCMWCADDSLASLAGVLIDWVRQCATPIKGDFRVALQRISVEYNELFY